MKPTMPIRRPVAYPEIARERPGERGIALIMSLSILVMLTMLVFGFAGIMQVEQKATSNMADLAAARVIAENGIERARARIWEGLQEDPFFCPDSLISMPSDDEFATFAEWSDAPTGLWEFVPILQREGRSVEPLPMLDGTGTALENPYRLPSLPLQPGGSEIPLEPLWVSLYNGELNPKPGLAQLKMRQRMIGRTAYFATAGSLDINASGATPFQDAFLPLDQKVFRGAGVSGREVYSPGLLEGLGWAPNTAYSAGVASFINYRRLPNDLRPEMYDLRRLPGDMRAYISPEQLRLDPMNQSVAAGMGAFFNMNEWFAIWPHVSLHSTSWERPARAPVDFERLDLRSIYESAEFMNLSPTELAQNQAFWDRWLEPLSLAVVDAKEFARLQPDDDIMPYQLIANMRDFADPDFLPTQLPPNLSLDGAPILGVEPTPLLHELIVGVRYDVEQLESEEEGGGGGGGLMGPGLQMPKWKVTVRVRGWIRTFNPFRPDVLFFDNDPALPYMDDEDAIPPVENYGVTFTSYVSGSYPRGQGSSGSGSEGFENMIELSTPGDGVNLVATPADAPRGGFRSFQIAADGGGFDPADESNGILLLEEESGEIESRSEPRLTQAIRIRLGRLQLWNKAAAALVDHALPGNQPITISAINLQSGQERFWSFGVRSDPRVNRSQMAWAPRYQGVTLEYAASSTDDLDRDRVPGGLPLNSDQVPADVPLRELPDFYIRNGPFATVGEVGLIHTGYEFSTLRLLPEGDGRLLDYLSATPISIIENETYIDSAEEDFVRARVLEAARGKVSVNTRKAPVLRALLSRIPTEVDGEDYFDVLQTEGRVSGTTAIEEWLELNSTAPEFWLEYGLGGICELYGITVNRKGAPEMDYFQEEIIRRISNQITLDPTYTVMVWGQSVRDPIDPDAPLVILAESKMLAVLQPEYEMINDVRVAVGLKLLSKRIVDDRGQ
ncbi:MAG: hypothetical protein PHG55_11110 [Verrucomicrobiota bacterium]|nr:hypothetical protein [Verrucomicrobiota bacterium]